MMFPLAIISFALSANAISAVDRVSYEDLKQLNASCHPEDTCAGRKPDHFPGISYPNTCSCHAECSLLGTCCMDSPHRGKSAATHECGAVAFPEMFPVPSGYYMVQSCPESAVWRHLCESGLDKDGDVLKIAPVTSLDTNTTYRNYYCFRCYELTENFLYWDLNLSGVSDGPPPPVTDDFGVTYNDVDNTWSTTAVDRDVSITVNLQFYLPQRVILPVIQCNPNMVTDCPDSWKDDTIRNKCQSYTAFLYKVFGPVYKNAHCALCNSQPLDELVCIPPQYAIVRKFFSFAHLIDVNRSDEEEASKKEKCQDGEKWDPYGKKCRKLSCALPGYVIKGGKCIAP